MDKLNNKKDFGLCYAGSGMLSAILSYGSFSELKDICHNIKYISCVSGASWFFVHALYYDKLSYDVFLDPFNCTLENLEKNKLESYGDLFSKIDLINSIISFDSKLCDNHKWINMIYDIFYKKYDDEKILNKYIQINLAKYPYLIVNATVYYNDIRITLPIEFTQNDVNLPNFHNSNDESYGGYIIKIKDSCKNFNFFPYVQSALSSNIIDLSLERITFNNYNTNSFQLFNPNTNKINHCNIGDGGDFDDTGLLALCRRKTKNILVNIFSSIPITSLLFKNDIITPFLSCLFKGNLNSEKNGIFDLGIWDNLYKEFLNKFELGLPITVLLTTNVLDNEHFQLEGYGPVNFLFHITSRTQQWFDQLPINTQQLINEKYKSFPYISLFKNNFDIKLTSLLFNLQKWDMRNSPEYKIFFNEFYK